MDWRCVEEGYQISKVKIWLSSVTCLGKNTANILIHQIVKGE